MVTDSQVRRLVREMEEGKGMAVAVKNEAPHEESEHDHFIKENPEVKAILRGMTEQHWDTWPDIPIPALRGMTPRRAAKDPVGRELLESLLLDFESRNGR